MRLYILVGVLCVVPLAQAEVIQVRGCAPGWTLHEAGSDWWCVADMPGGGGGGGGPGPGGGDGEQDPWGDWGGVPDPQNWDNDALEEFIAEAKKRANCNRCKNSGNKCIAQAQDAEKTCVTRANQMALWRCSGQGEIRKDPPGLTIWGCTTTQLANSMCAAAEEPWNDPNLWKHACWPGKSFFQMECGDRSKQSCVDSWASPHPGGSRSTSASGTLSAIFEGFGGTTSTTVSSTFTLNGHNGFMLACSEAGTSLSGQCVSKEQQCRAQYDCASLDKP
jgi:hypothetical protein